MLRLACSSIPDLVCQAAADGLSSADRARARQSEEDLEGRKEGLAQALFDHIPVGVGSQGIIPTTAADLEAALEMGMDWSLREVGPGLGRGPTPPLPCGPQQRCLRVMTVGHVANRAGRAQAPHADLGPRPSGAAARGGRPAPITFCCHAVGRSTHGGRLAAHPLHARKCRQAPAPGDLRPGA